MGEVQAVGQIRIMEETGKKEGGKQQGVKKRRKASGGFPLIYMSQILMALEKPDKVGVRSTRTLISLQIYLKCA